MRRILFAVILLLSGCGSDWSPGNSAAPVSQFSVTGEYVGVMMNSQRVGAGDYTIVASKGVFSTYTSLSVPPRSAVYLDTIKDTGTGLLIGQVLRSLEQTALVKEVLVLVR